MGELIYQDSTGPNGAVAALARRVDHVLQHGGSDDSLICDVWANNQWSSVTSTSMVTATRESVRILNLTQNGFDTDLVGSHSLRSGGAMALKPMNYKDSTIRKLGRWKSDTWQMYIHSQIDKLHQGVAAAMSTPHVFKNIAAIEAPQAAQMLAAR